jgi:predicted transcriptional regulator YdeE
MGTPKIVELELAPTTVVGVSGMFTSALAPNSDAHRVIPQLWKELMDVTGENFYKSDWSVGVMNEVDGDERMNYVAAIRLSDNDGRHDGLELVELSGGKYVACEHVGSLDNFSETAGWFYREYLANSGLHVRDGYHLEIYDERFDPESPDSVVLICAPVS